jgi:hypothetical protein
MKGILSFAKKYNLEIIFVIDSVKDKAFDRRWNLINSGNLMD